ncbi:MAG: CDP-diacylglycerol--serine O-phosphatidyltransferase [Parvibaculaceae bacterium]|nr:CDP-diacylglycerol--serine O-phosphatidyltransferase [Parvibaculaceae bacterium]
MSNKSKDTDSKKPETHPRRHAMKRLPIRSLIPNSLTVFALCAGLTSIRFALEGRFEFAVIAILVASIFDGLDGRVARLLRGTSKFGAELDSLTDFVNFGVAPVLVLYLWCLQAWGGLGWIAVLGYAVCCALRLARFNVDHDDPDRPAWMGNYFTGVPAPAGALLVMLPLYLSFEGATGLPELPWLIALHTALVAFLMVSRIPSFSGKRLGIKISRDKVAPILLGVALFAALWVSYPWIMLAALSIGYLILLPVSSWRYAQNKAQQITPYDDPDSHLL